MKLNKILVAISALVLFSPFVLTNHAQAASDVYIKIEPVNGKRIDKIPLIGLRYEHEIKSPRDVATGQSSGKRQHQPIVIRKEWDKSSPVLMKFAEMNELLPAVQLIFTGDLDGDGAPDLHTIKLKNAKISMISSVPQRQGGGATKTTKLEDLVLAYESIEIDGKPAGENEDILKRAFVLPHVFESSR